MSRRWLLASALATLVLTGCGGTERPRPADPAAYDPDFGVAKPAVFEAGVRPAATAASLGVDGEPLARAANAGSMSADGRWVAFVEGHDITGRPRNIFVRDLRGGQTRLAIECTADFRRLSWIPSECDRTALSADGRYLLFDTRTALVPADTNGVQDVYRLDLHTRALRRVSVVEGGAQSPAGGFEASMSDDGTRIAFVSLGDLDPVRPRPVSRYGAASPQVYVHDLSAGTVRLASFGRDGKAGSGQSATPRIAGDGSSVAFRTEALSIVTETNGEDTRGLAVKRLDDDRPAIDVGALLPGHDHVVAEFTAPSDGGRRIALAYGTEDFRAATVVVDLRGGRIVRTVESRKGRALTSAADLALSRDGTVLGFSRRKDDDALVDGDANRWADVFCIDVGSGALVWLTRGQKPRPKGEPFGSAARVLAWDATGRTALVELTRTSERVWNSQLFTIRRD